MPSPLKFRTLLLRCSRLISDECNLILLPHQLNYSLWQVLYVIQEQSEITSIDLAKYLNVSKPSIAKRVHTLLQLDLLEQVFTEDKRQKKLKLSKQGQSLFETCSQKIDQFEQRLLVHINPNDLKQSSETLSQLLYQLEYQSQGADA
ncbi:MarR family transcriptional regulator [Acinetobacter sp. TGL-Y2]|uniref:MarR family winged helix-turn-helix transcriptional regulator n=1 Tax=Acinetobacter sp. TGL-Y2 TaxID=1407071 RepID=UPI0007A645EA|nr:MarR family transcriptional regulator [Acinetobacter sp. TGL-Y2]AMW78853.1 MarR family transcriptional regulator [Acinetobacter sp. TGL-Y2]